MEKGFAVIRGPIVKVNKYEPTIRLTHPWCSVTLTYEQAYQVHQELTEALEEFVKRGWANFRWEEE